MKRLTWILMALVIGFSASAQNVKASGPQLWKTLANIDYEITQDEYGDLYVPVFGDDIKALQGQTVEVQGFIIPFEGMFKPEQLILSALPISECFFCGSGGPETVMEITMNKGDKVKYTPKRVKIQGKLVLNRDDPDKLMYQLENAKYVGLVDGAY